MNRLRLAGLLLRPSLLSTITILALTTLVLGIANWSYVLESPLFYDYFYGQYGLISILQRSPDSFSAFRSALFGQTINYNAVILISAVVIGVAIYIVLHIISKMLNAASSTWEGVQYSQGQAKKVLEEEIGLRVGVRAAAITLWIIYFVLFIKIILPFCLLISRFGINELSQISGWAYSLLGFGVLLVSLHVHVLFMRIVLLRFRVFGGNDVALLGRH